MCRGALDYVEGGMIFEDADGEGVRVDSSPRHEDLVDEVIVKFHERGVPVADIAKALNRSKTYVYKRLRVVRREKKGEARGDPHLVPLFGANPHWSPEVERKHALCKRCGGMLGPIHEGSSFVCLACLHSGHDEELMAELKREREKVKMSPNGDRQTKSFAERRYSP